MSKEKFKPCPGCGRGKVMTDELRRGFNGQVDGKARCADCIISSIYARKGLT